MKKIMVLLTIGLAITGCQTVSEQFTSKGICQANSTETLVGQQGLTTEKILEISKASTARIVRPGQAVTMDYRAERVTVMVDDNQKIIHASCG